MKLKKTQFVIRYIQMLRNYNSLISIHVSYANIDEYVVIGILTKHRFVRIELDNFGIWYKTSLNDFTTIQGKFFITKYNRESIISKYIVSEDVTEELRELVRSVGATVVAPSDFQSEMHQKPNNQ